MDKPSTQRPYKQNALFRGDAGTFHLNACVGPNGGPYDFHDYARGYVRAGITLVENANSSRNPVDIMIYSIAYCFRHAVELYLKHLSMELPKLWREDGCLKATHKLLDNWTFVASYLRRDNAFDEDGTLIAQAEKILKDFVDIDPKGEVFRFPFDREGNAFLQDTRLINVVVLGEAMAELGEMFDFWCYQAQEIWEYKVQYEWIEI